MGVGAPPPAQVRASHILCSEQSEAWRRMPHARNISSVHRVCVKPRTRV